jgi:hypothetical protein
MNLDIHIVKELKDPDRDRRARRAGDSNDNAFHLTYSVVTFEGKGKALA